MSNKDTVLTKIHHEDVAKSVHEDVKKSLAEHGSYDPSERLMAEMKASEKALASGPMQAPAKSYLAPEVKLTEIKPANDPVEAQKTSHAGLSATLATPVKPSSSAKVHG